MLRHDAQSNIAAIRKGVDFQTLQYLMGHSDNSVIPENTLVHLRMWVGCFLFLLKNGWKASKIRGDPRTALKE